MSTGTPPRVRAAHTQGTFHVLLLLEPERLPAVLEHLDRLDPTLRPEVEAAEPTSRIPAEWDVMVVRTLAQVLGREAMRRVARTTMVDALSGPQLGALLTGALRLFGATPAGLYRWAGRAWGHVTEGCGTLKLDRAEGQEAWLLIDGMPPSLADPDYLEAVAGTLEAIFDVCQVDGDVSVVPRADGGRFHAVWRARTPRR